MIVFIILGVVLLVFSFTLNTTSNSFSKYSVALKAVGVLLIFLGVVSAVFKQIDAGKVGVKSLYGSVQSDILESGLSLINPLMDVTEFDIQTQNYTMSAVHSEGAQQGDDAIRVLSNDGLEVVIDLTVLFRISPESAPKIFKEIGVNYSDKIVRPVTRTRIRDNAVYYDAVALYSTKRNEFQQRIFKTIEADFKARGLVLEQLLIRNINLPASVKASIESKINAEQDAQKMTFVLQKEKQEAERKRVEAQGIADYQRIISTGLSDKQLQYEQIKAQKELAASSNTKIIFMNGRGSAPIILSDK
ncbi:regulator of protease activity HflC (stomatin/prohibitin superfamily) [Flavobacterium tiangeerense]|uniref:Regulator of protease activity HflC (Stomatin/prohibitin superfamily) n=1 Tax=Flavobacterium tiangeerense TaxID=459471 RepID=A0ABY3FN76_9FLAO|nr:prohibitin family protein [Flavobacterium tiangeerense]TWI03254.1 regulator of protease activity HflC (stomatin/prohibitin superfamily) [Flavobacterium tiangeerense]